MNYDVLGRLGSLASPGGTFTWTYATTTGRPLTVMYPNNQKATYDYFDNLGDHRLKQIKHEQTAGGAVLSKFDYTYDVVGNIKTWTQLLSPTPAKVYDFGYDAADQLTTARLSAVGPPQTLLKRHVWTYDPAGNRTGEQIDDAPTAATHNNRNQLLSRQAGGDMLFRGTTNEPAKVTVQSNPATVDASNTFQSEAQVTSGTTDVVVSATDYATVPNTRTNTYRVNVSGSPASYTYDLNGNMTSKTEGGVTTTYDWDAENKLTAVKTEQGANTLASFVYDGNGRRLQKASGGVTRTYIYDDANAIEERLSSGQTTDFVQAGLDRPIAQRDQGGVLSYYLADHLDSIVQLTNSAAAVTLGREYDPWGNQLQGGATAGHAFTGREWDAEIGIYYYRARYYDSKVGRFISEDTVPNNVGTKIYAYVGSNPLIYTDPSGMVKKITVCKAQRTLTLCEDSTELMTAAIKTGCSETPTPTGKFRAGPWVKDPVNTKHSGPDPWTKDPWDNPYGPWFLPVEGTGGVGIHGTRGPESLGNLFIRCPDFDISPLCSHGCIRISNSNIKKLHDLLPKSAGTPVTIKDTCQ